jgi:hypothetical protein
MTSDATGDLTNPLLPNRDEVNEIFQTPTYAAVVK